MRELIRLALRAVRAHRLRSALSMLGIAIGIASVILLTSIGEGTRRYIVDQFTQFGTNILAINPGKTETVGLPGVFGGTTQKLTLDDAEALRRVPGVRRRRAHRLRHGAGRGRRPRPQRLRLRRARRRCREVWQLEASAPAPSGPAATPAAGPTTAVLGPTLEARAVRRAQGAGRVRQDRRHPLPGHRHHGAQGPDAGLRPRRRGLHPGRRGDEDLQPRRADRDRPHLHQLAGPRTWSSGACGTC